MELFNNKKLASVINEAMLLPFKACGAYCDWLNMLVPLVIAWIK